MTLKLHWQIFAHIISIKTFVLFTQNPLLGPNLSCLMINIEQFYWGLPKCTFIAYKGCMLTRTHTCKYLPGGDVVVGGGIQLDFDG